MAKCFYCFEDKTLTKAHLFQDFFRRAMDPTNGVRLASTSITDDDDGRAISHPGDARFANVTSLCGECNSNWMQRIESAAGPYFFELVKSATLPPPIEGLRLAHWASVVGALSSELYPKLSIPESHRRAIRSANLLPESFSVFCIWTSDYLPGLQTDIFRGVDEEKNIYWLYVLHVGSIVLMVATPGLLSRTARVLDDAQIKSMVAYVGPVFVYLPDGTGRSIAQAPRPTHGDVHKLAPEVLGGGRYRVARNGAEVLDLPQVLKFADVDRSFDFTGLLHDYRTLGARDSS